MKAKSIRKAMYIKTILGYFALNILSLFAVDPPASPLNKGPASPFSFDLLKKEASTLAKQPYSAPRTLSSEVLEQIDYDAHGKIRFKTDHALWAQGPGEFPVTFFHLGRYFQTPVRMYEVIGAEAREIRYDVSYFDMPKDSPARKLSADSGFAGFRFQEQRTGSLDWQKNDWVAFLGASYFRTIGELYQYGLSARALAINVAVPGKNEEFPIFTRFYFETPAPGEKTVVVYALLEGPSVAGAYRFEMTRAAAVVMNVEADVHLRQDVERLGLAPLTSMYWFSETAKPTALDWRPEVHDSDGLALWTGTGERAWRPLNNPPRVITSSFMDNNPRGFGLSQRDRVFDHYLDGVYYDRRPTLWIEPQGEWGKGSVQLIEIPTNDEIHDNIVAMWVPEAPAKTGSYYKLRYKMHWVKDEPAGPLARCVALRLGNGGQAGTQRPEGVRKFVIEFMGGPLSALPDGAIPEAVVSAGRGKLSNFRVEAVPDDVPGHWRAYFDLAADGTDPVELRCFLRHEKQVLSETWLYQYHPM
ncbi:MAG: glucan biosynthesis protein D [Puniceicoccales bacterium]|jgi:glucans biosynthesis protein|nr:glucan biosynthesis protein D [Puniceicoccales bacterium]